MDADVLGAMFPQMRCLHIMREPKDIYCSVRQRDWGLDTVDAFVSWYNTVMSHAWRAQETLDESRYMTLSIERLVHDPRGMGRMVLAFSGLSESDDVIERFAERVGEGQSHMDRWRRELRADEAQAIDRQCASMYQRWLGKTENCACS